MEQSIAPAAERPEIVILNIIRRRKDSLETEYEETETELRKLQARRSELEDEVTELERQELFWAEKSGETARAISQSPSVSASAATTVDRIRARFHEARSRVQDSHADAAKRVLEEAGVPLSTAAIVERLHQQGRRMADTPRGRAGAIYSAMWRRKDDFLVVSPGVWGLVGRDGEQPVNGKAQESESDRKANLAFGLIETNGASTLQLNQPGDSA